MNRKDIGGVTFKVFSFFIEIVTINKVPKVLAISKPINSTIWRYE